MKSHFSSDFFKSNRDHLRKLFIGTAPIVITANSLLQRNSDIAYPFRQDSNFWYLTGITDPDVVLVMDKEKEYLITPGHNQIRTIFEGGINAESISERSGVAEVLDNKEGWRRLYGRLRRVQNVATLAAPPGYVENYEFYTNPARAKLIERLSKEKAELEFLDLREHFSKMRSKKQPEEIEAIKSSVDLTAATLKKIKPKLKGMKFEYEAEAFITNAFRSHGTTHGYSPIIASGVNACTLHYDDNNSKLSDRDLVLLDVGAEAEYYSADITRTYALNEPTKRQRDVHAAVLEVQEFVMSYIKPGISLKDSEHKVEQFMGEKLRELGLIKVVESGAVRRYFPHATSHFLGLDLHDIGNYQKPLEADMVITVEPGIYIPEEGLGVRIEDDILITPSGRQILSDNVSKGLN